MLENKIYIPLNSDANERQKWKISWNWFKYLKLNMGVREILRGGKGKENSVKCPVNVSINIFFIT